MGIEVGFKRKKEVKGIKSMRAGRSSRTPNYHCDNCNCDRYNECGCMRAKTKK